MKQIVVWIAALGLIFLMTACTKEENAQTLPESNVQTTMAQEASADSEDKTESGEPAVLEKLEIVSMPKKTDYFGGETADLEGLEIRAILSDGSTQENVPWECPDPVIANRMEFISITCMGKTLRIPVTVIYRGNAEEYSLQNTGTVENSPVKGNTYFWLGSSVTYGAFSDGISIPDYFAKKWDCVSIKEAVSGTTLNALNSQSYVERLNKYLESADRASHLDGFICQLSTNDTRTKDAFGMVLPDMITVPEAFDVNTTFGAMEYICAKVKETWDCPIYFFTNPPFNDNAYEDMVAALEQMASKWDITIIDMYRDESFNSISSDERALYMGDKIHPTMAGYRDWWLVKFESALIPDV